MNRLAAAVLLVALCGCEPETPPTPPPPNPPQVFLTVNENNVIGDTVRGRVNVSGCKNVAQVQLLQREAFLYDVQYSKSPTEFALPAGLFSALYSQLGIAASLSLRAKVLCDDGRTNTSQPVGVSFFPVASRLSKGEQVVPDSFVAEGGFGGTPTTFLGCVGTQLGTAIARVDTQGNVLAYNDQLPFGCSINTQISDRSLTTGMRWVFEPLAGAFAMDGSLNVHKVVRSQQARRIGVGKAGSAVIWLDEPGTQNRIYFAKPQVETTNDWTAAFYGIMNSTPVIDDRVGGAVWVSSWQYQLAVSPRRGDQVAYKHDIANGTLLNGIAMGTAPVLVQQFYPEINNPIMPEATFSADGSLYVVPLLSWDATGFIRTTVIACATTGGLCDTPAIRRWTSPTVDGILRNVVSFSAGNYYAAMGPYAVYFLNAQLGTIVNLGEQPLRPEGSNIVFGGQPGLGSDFYVLTGPVLGEGVASYPTEIIATDRPESGELYRMQSGSGESPTAANWIAIDDNAQPWFRVGIDLVKPLANTEYRNARGPTVLP